MKTRKNNKKKTCQNNVVFLIKFYVHLLPISVIGVKWWPLTVFLEDYLTMYNYWLCKFGDFTTILNCFALISGMDKTWVSVQDISTCASIPKCRFCNGMTKQDSLNGKRTRLLLRLFSDGSSAFNVDVPSQVRKKKKLSYNTKFLKKNSWRLYKSRTCCKWKEWKWPFCRRYVYRRKYLMVNTAVGVIACRNIPQTFFCIVPSSSANRVKRPARSVHVIGCHVVFLNYVSS